VPLCLNRVSKIHKTPLLMLAKAFIIRVEMGTERAPTFVNNNLAAPGLNVSVIGGPAQVEPGSLKYYTQGFLQMVVDANAVSAGQCAPWRRRHGFPDGLSRH
jgi:hypothetical protein